MLSLKQLIEIGEKYDDRIREYLVKASQYDCLEDLVLDDFSMGYTLKTLAASIWCLFHCNSFEEGLLAVVNVGGDADTNAAVACSLLGAKYGYSAIPQKYIDGLIRRL
jgi:ADP-ribosylglycohydrolase